MGRRGSCRCGRRSWHDLAAWGRKGCLGNFHIVSPSPRLVGYCWERELPTCHNVDIWQGNLLFHLSLRLVSPLSSFLYIYYIITFAFLQILEEEKIHGENRAEREKGVGLSFARLALFGSRSLALSCVLSCSLLSFLPCSRSLSLLFSRSLFFVEYRG